MKKLKKMIAVLLVAAMTLAMGMTTFAAEETGSLKVKVNDDAATTLQGQDIYIFKLFDLENDGETYNYTVNAAYKNALTTALGMESGATDYDIYSEIQSLGLDNAIEVQNFANNFTEQIITKTGINGTLNTDYQLAADILQENANSYTFSDVDYGYYLVYLGGGVQIQSSLVTVDKATDTEINLKTETPDAEKTANVADAQIGQVVKFTVETMVPDSSAYSDYVFKLHDTLSDGLDFVKNLDGDALEENLLPVTVKVNDVEYNPALTATVKERKMELDLSTVVANNQGNNIGKKITVEYYAKLNENATVNNTQNSAYVEYSNKPGTDGIGTSIPDVEKVPTFMIKVHKYEKGKDDEYLAGAVFELYNDEDGSQGTTAYKVTGSDGVYVIAADQTSGSKTEMTTFASELDNGGYNLSVNGLAAGTYWLVEKTAPTNYNKIEAIKIVITNTTEGDGEVSYTITVGDPGTLAQGNIVGVENSKGVILPSTGGMGTIIFTVVAVILIAGVGASFVISRKKKH